MGILLTQFPISFRYYRFSGGVAQVVEHTAHIRSVRGSKPCTANVRFKPVRFFSTSIVSPVTFHKRVTPGLTMETTYKPFKNPSYLVKSRYGFYPRHEQILGRSQPWKEVFSPIIMQARKTAVKANSCLTLSDMQTFRRPGQKGFARVDNRS